MFNKFICYALLLLTSASIFAAPPKDKPLELTLHGRQFTLSTYYDIDSDQGSFGNIIKTSLSLRSNYQYFNGNGECLSDAYVRLFSLGALFSWAAVIDIYDSQQKPIGLIEGSLLTLLPSKFHFYNEQNQEVGIAYMDHNCLGFTVTDPIKQNKIIASMHRIFTPGIPDYWSLYIEDLSAIDLRLLLTFAAFALDNQGDFKEDN